MPNMKMERSWLKLTFKGQIGKIREKKKGEGNETLKLSELRSKKSKRDRSKNQNSIKGNKGKVKGLEDPCKI